VFDEPGVATTAWQQPLVSGLFPDAGDAAPLLQRLKDSLGGTLPEHHVEPVPDRDWERAWMERYQPVHVGGRLWICPSWCEPAQPDAVNLVLDPGLAFGSGTHATTRLCLEWLVEKGCAEAVVLDYGCGSGILAIAALLLGARQAVAVDLDPQALIATTDNARRNGVDERLRVCQPDQLAGFEADIVLANILSETLIRLRPTLLQHLRPEGSLVLSGILASQADNVQQAYRPDPELAAVELDGWVRLAGTRRKR
jgi:ribosomal protein L11 methyltransferase